MPPDPKLEEEINNEHSIERAQRKRDQAWKMTGLDRNDGDDKDSVRRTEEARAWGKRVREIKEQ